MSLAAALTWNLSAYGYGFLFLAAAVEGPIATFAAGSLSGIGYFRFWPALAVIVAADVTADCLLYWLGRSGRRGIQSGIGRRLGLTSKRIERFEVQVSKRPAHVMGAAKLAHGIGGAILAAAGAAKMPFMKFALLSLVMTAVKSLLLLSLGYYFGNGNSNSALYLHAAALLSAIAAVGLGWKYSRDIIASAPA